MEVLVGDLDVAEAAAREALRLAGPGDDNRAYALLGLATVAGTRGEREEAVRFGREALEEIDVVDDPGGFRLDVAAVFVEAGLRQEAGTMYEEVSHEARRLGVPLLIAGGESGASWLALLEERYEVAEANFRSALEALRDARYAPFEANTLRNLGVALLALGRRDEARTAFISALEILATYPSPDIELAATLEWIALATERAAVRPAARLVGAATAVRQNARLVDRPTELELRRRFEQPLIDALGEDEWAREQAAGATLTLAEAIELAHTLAAGPPETARQSA
jgi:tetratricopeptide (TPR) repeat protein